MMFNTCKLSWTRINNLEMLLTFKPELAAQWISIIQVLCRHWNQKSCHCCTVSAEKLLDHLTQLAQQLWLTLCCPVKWDQPVWLGSLETDFTAVKRKESLKTMKVRSEMYRKLNLVTSFINNNSSNTQSLIQSENKKWSCSLWGDSKYGQQSAKKGLSFLGKPWA